MIRRFTFAAVALSLLAACAGPATQVAVGPDGLPGPQVYRIAPEEAGEVQARMLEGVNALRRAAGEEPVVLDPRLNAAAATHSRDMAVQNRPWHFGSDGSSPLDRAQRVGYGGTVLGEAISESYESELETLAAWMAEDPTREVILDPRARDMGISWFQEPAGKLWWTLVMGNPTRTGPAPIPAPVAAF